MGTFLHKIKNLLLSKYFWFLVLFVYLGITCKFRPWMLLLNVICSIVLIISFSLIFNRLTFSIFLTFSIACLLQIANFIKVNLFKTPLEVHDLVFLRKVYLQGIIWEYLDLYIIMLVTIYAVLCWIVWFYSEKVVTEKKISIKKFIFYRIISIGTGIFLLSSILITVANPNSKIVKSMQNHYKPIVNKFSMLKIGCFWKFAFSKRIGPFAAVVLSLSDINMKPINPSQDSELLKKQLPQPTIKIPKHLPDIVAILHESTFDPQILDYHFAQDLNFDFFNKDQYTKFDGLLNVNTFGGCSFVSEYEINTGLSHEVFTGLSKMTFYFLTPITKTSLFKELKKLGYKVIVLYPNEKTLANANNAYSQLGIDEIKDIYDYNHYNISWQKVKDKFIANMIIDTLENNQDQPVFIFAATVSNHAPHSNTQQDSVNCLNEIKDSTTCSKINDYISRLKETEQDISKLTNYLMNREKKTMMVNFGDHLPSFEGYMHQLNLKTNYYKTFYNIKSNFNIDLKEEYNILDITFIPGLVLDIIDYNNNTFYQANSFMRKLCKGNLKKCSSKNIQFIESYKAITLEQFNIARDN